MVGFDPRGYGNSRPYTRDYSAPDIYHRDARNSPSHSTSSSLLSTTSSLPPTSPLFTLNSPTSPCTSSRSLCHTTTSILSPPSSPPPSSPLITLHSPPLTPQTHAPSTTHVSSPSPSSSDVPPPPHTEDPPSISTPSNLSTPPTEPVTLPPPPLSSPTTCNTHTYTRRSRRQRLPARAYYGHRKQRKSRNNNNYVVNLSSKILSQDAINLLSKGLGYAPTPAPPDSSNITEDLEAFARRLRITHYFRNSTRQHKKHPFKLKSQWAPPKASNPKLEEYIEKTLAEEPERRHPKPNLSKKEARTLQELGKNRDLVIKKADKGSCIVIQDRSTYVAEGKSHLADTSTYKPLESDPTAAITECVGNIVDSMKEVKT